MTPELLLLVTVSTLAWALFDVSRKQLMVSKSAPAAAVGLMLWQSPVFIAIGLASDAPTWTPQLSYWPPALLSILLNALGHLFFLESVAMAPLSIVIPILSLTPVFSTIGAIFILQEIPSMLEVGGISVVVCGALGFGWLGIRQPGGKGQPPTAAVERARNGVLLMILVAFLWATTPVIDKYCLGLVSTPVHAFYQCIGVGISLFLFFSSREKEFTWAGTISFRQKWLWLASSFAAVALGTQMVAITMMPVGVFEACKRALGIVLAIAFGRVFFKEKVTGEKVFFAIIMGLGFLLLFFQG